MKKCKICGRFMRRLKLLERVVIEVCNGGIRTHICKKEIFYKLEGRWGHEMPNKIDKEVDPGYRDQQYTAECRDHERNIENID